MTWAWEEWRQALLAPSNAYRAGFLDWYERWLDEQASGARKDR